ncbi:hypothetical protein ACELLULO517_10185 [Acidisoma cellulosilytica]|uniref:Uncharacterized protein n=1 Tax=Acidisoma cellulosilyticum TaxID=2802395 RepID=A0A963Z277_9PROT|nr:hypothetical protein [Acidisoma cellulosilyticum]MCB8880602.1 hypothetical protein [Acidisoma cellulosilyticum]
MEKNRPLLMVVIGLGIVILLATTVVIVKVVKDIITGHPQTTQAASSGPTPDTIALTTNMLSQPAGSHIVTISGVGDRLSVLINGGGPDRILFVDPATGHVTGQLMLGK